MIELLGIWTPVLLFLGVGLLIARRQMASYGRHVGEVRQINEEISSLARQNHALAREQLDVLKQIKSLLEDRKT